MRHVAWLLLLVMATIYVQAGETDMTWEEYKAKYKKSYANAEEEEKHHQSFLASLKHVEAHNQKRARGEVSYSIGINQFSDQDRSGSKPSDTAAPEDQTRNIGPSHNESAAA
ncbi:digestive cysteine proteinase 1 [Thrips palmi]|uniref:Digestive cysteine proteinase 1 n=1 Tax=Thrips palmi TaxID=161013 RepID=A0A6P8YSF1_THRPL|nr:digestive cysteine proteinase 1 [Thrips palmi]